jgi:hypothetical protein
MNISISIDEKVFNESGVAEAIKEAFENMDKEEKSKIMKDILKQYLLDSEFVHNYFIETKRDSWIGSSKEYPTKEFVELVKMIDFTTEMEEVKDVFMNVVKTDLKKEVLKLMVDSYVNTIANQLFNDSSDFKERLNARLFDTYRSAIGKMHEEMHKNN